MKNRVLRCISSAVCAVIALGMAGCGNGPGTIGVVPQAQNRPADYSSQQLFEGLFYGEGPTAALFPEWWSAQARQNEGLPASLTSEQHGRLLANMHALETEMSRVDPAFFNDFKAELTSGDPVRVSTMLQRVQHDAEAIVAAHNVDWKSLAARARPDISTKVYQNAYVYNNVAALNQAVYAQVVAVQQYGAVWTAVYVIAVVGAVVVIPLAKPGGTDYSNDAGVVLITQRLANL